jgi:uncharacterized protein (TIGR02270 family)
MTPIDFHNRPIIESIVEQHAEAAAALWLLRDRATDEPHYAVRHLARLEERIEANIDGLRVAGEAGWRIALAGLERFPEAGEMFVAGVLALESGDRDRLDALQALCTAMPEALRGLVGAIGWCNPRQIAPTVRHWHDSAERLEHYLTLCACSLHRAEPGPRFAAFLEDPDPQVKARALRLAGELGRVDLLDTVIRQVTDLDPEVAFWAAWSAVLLGDRRSALQHLQAVALSDWPRRWTALEVAVRSMGHDRSTAWVRAANGDPAQLRLVTIALGHIGDPVAVPWLIARMNDPDLARVAGESFSMITGLDLAYEDLDGEPPASLSELPTEDPADEQLEEDLDENLAWPAPDRVQTWWQSNGHRFPPRQRYLMGEPINEPNCQRVWADGFQHQRRAAAYEWSLLRPEAQLNSWKMRMYDSSLSPMV